MTTIKTSCRHKIISSMMDTEERGRGAVWWAFLWAIWRSFIGLLIGPLGGLPGGPLGGPFGGPIGGPLGGPFSGPVKIGCIIKNYELEWWVKKKGKEFISLWM